MISAEQWGYTILSVLIVSAISLIGVFTLAMRPEKLKKVLLYFVSFSAGALLGAAFLHLIPEAALEAGGLTVNISLYVLAGLLGFFVLEKLIHWRHCHIPTSSHHPHPFGMMNIIGDSVHNFLDGMAIAASYIVSIPVGISTTIAVVLHEIPQEIGDFGVLLHAGYERKKALLMNFITALTAVAGAVFMLTVGSMFNLTYFLIPFTAGGFIYIATADLIPELKKECELGQTAVQLIAIVLGVVLILLL